MAELTLSIPRMWADHHVLAVREILTGIGVQEVEASATRKLIRLSFDPARVQQDQILQALAEANYAPTEAAEFPQPLPNKDRRSAWFVQGGRMTQTNRLDLEMSGDFRKY